MEPVLKHYLERYLKTRCLKGDLSATLEALDAYLHMRRPLPEWLAPVVSQLVAEAAAKPKVVSKGPKGTDKAAIERNWIDLSRHLAVEHCERKMEKTGKKVLRKVVLEDARKLLAKEFPKRKKVRWRAIDGSDSRIRKEIEKWGFLDLSRYYDGDPGDLEDYFRDGEM